jgi:hypothetical protein
MPCQTYARPSIETLHAVSTLVHHILAMDLSSLTLDGPLHHHSQSQPQQQAVTGGKKRDPSLQGLEGVYQALKGFTYRSLRQHLYPFLRLALEHWPRDESLGDVVDLWLRYITPWTAFGEAIFSDVW